MFGRDAGTGRRRGVRLRAVDAALVRLGARIGPGLCAEIGAGAAALRVEVSAARSATAAPPHMPLLLQTPGGALSLSPARELLRALAAIDLPDDHGADPLHALRLELAAQSMPQAWFDLFGASAAVSCAPQAGGPAEVVLTVTQPEARLAVAATLRGDAGALLQALARPGWRRVDASASPLPTDWALRVPVPAGHAALPARTFRALAAGDIVLLTDPCLDADGRLALRIGRRGASCRLHLGNRTRLEITEWDDTTMGPNMTQALDSAPSSAGQDADLGDVPVLLSFELGSLELSLAELQALAPGAVLPLAGPLPPQVGVYASGRRIGSGELVELDGRLGVEIRRIGASS